MTNILILGAHGEIARVATELFLEEADVRLTLYCATLAPEALPVTTGSASSKAMFSTPRSSKRRWRGRTSSTRTSREDGGAGAAHRPDDGKGRGEAAHLRQFHGDLRRDPGSSWSPSWGLTRSRRRPSSSRTSTTRSFAPRGSTTSTRSTTGRPKGRAVQEPRRRRLTQERRRPCGQARDDSGAREPSQSRSSQGWLTIAASFLAAEVGVADRAQR